MEILIGNVCLQFVRVESVASLICVFYSKLFENMVNSVFLETSFVNYNFKQKY